jgi:AcrR family transcriptional regulator
VQAPTIYRLFGDKHGRLDAVAEHVLAVYVAEKAVAADSGDPIADLRAAWHTHVGFGLANAALFSLIADPEGAAARRPRPRAWRYCGTVCAASRRPAGSG